MTMDYTKMFIERAYDYHKKFCKAGQTSRKFCFFCACVADGKKQTAHKNAYCELCNKEMRK